MSSIKNISKREFRERCDTNHVYGTGRGKHNAIYFDWQETEKGRGFKYGVAVSIEHCTKKELFDYFYDWVVNSIALPYYVRYKCAETDAQRFKVPICLNF